MNMMRVLSVCALLLCLMTCGALAETVYTIEGPFGNDYTCTDYDGELPEDVRAILAPVLREGDEVLCGTRGQGSPLKKQDVWWDQILLAVRREGRVLLLCALNSTQEGWDVWIETDSFISEGSAFDITFLPSERGEGWYLAAAPSILCDDEIWRMVFRQSNRGYLNLSAYERRSGDTREIVQNYDVMMMAYTIRDGVYREQGKYKCSTPMRLAAWDMESFPRDGAQLQQYAETHQPRHSESQAFLCGANLREKPTSKSRLIGTYSARAEVLGSQMGKVEPWYHVRVGDTEGWVTANYCLNGSQYDIRYYAMGAVSVNPARADREIELRRSPDGEVFARLLPGAMMHVIIETDGWLHVIVPQDGELGPIADWDGVYGYVRSSEVVRGVTLANLRWK